MNLLPFIDLIEDLNRELTQAQRYQRLVQAIHHAIPCEAVALLQLEGSYLRPVAVIGLKHEAVARRFHINQHPRLEQILRSEEVTRFESDSPLADPYDGLLDSDQQQLHVHDCMGSPLYINGELWGALTLDALMAGSFDNLRSDELRAYIAAVAATIKTSQYINALQARLERNQEVTQRLMDTGKANELLGNSPAMEALLGEIHTVAPSDLSVLITGETGVGKDLVARSIHRLSRRSDHPLVQVNCAALPETIVESELFGHLRGAFTGATRNRTGRFELADGGTLYLDEIGELSLSVQAKLLRVLQNGEIQRVGSDEAMSVDVRIIAATNRDLQKEVDAGRFRADLFHRLSVYPLPVPPLRDREQDTELLAGFFLERFGHKFGTRRLRLATGVNRLLQAYDWPGNVRELEHLLSRASLKAIREQGRDAYIVSIKPEHLDLPQDAARPELSSHGTVSELPAATATLGLREQTDAFHRSLIATVLAQHDGNLAATARALQLDRSNLVRTMRRLDTGSHLIYPTRSQ